MNATKFNNFFTMTRLIVLYWAMYWIMNGLDKFLNRTDLNIFTWFGKDRSAQFGGYFEKTALPEGLIHPLLYLTGIIEIIVAIPFIICLAQSLSGKAFKEYADLLKMGIFLSGAVYVGFCFFDVIFGDRAELLEHTTFLVLVVTSHIYLFGHSEK